MTKNYSHSFRKSLIDCALRQSMAISLFLITLLFLILPQVARAQAPPCPDPPSSMSGPHTFHELGASLILPLNIAPCHTVTVDISWSNGLNNGSNLKVTFLDSSGQAIYSESDISAFLTGSRSFPLSPPYPYPWRGSRIAALQSGQCQDRDHLSIWRSMQHRLHDHFCCSARLQRWWQQLR